MRMKGFKFIFMLVLLLAVLMLTNCSLQYDSSTGDMDNLTAPDQDGEYLTRATSTAMQPNPCTGFVVNNCTISSHTKVAGLTHYHFNPRNTSAKKVDSFQYNFANYGQYAGPYTQNNDIPSGVSVTFYCNFYYNASYAPWMNIYNEKLK